jgi:anti-anti-sigma regulatory factor
VTPTEIHAALGKSVGPPGVANSTAATACTYPSTSGGRQNSVIITFRGQVTAAAAAAEQTALSKLHGTTSPLVNTTQVAITSTASLDQIENLSQQIFASFTSSATSSTAPAAVAG